MICFEIGVGVQYDALGRLLDPEQHSTRIDLTLRAFTQLAGVVATFATEGVGLWVTSRGEVKQEDGITFKVHVDEEILRIEPWRAIDWVARQAATVWNQEAVIAVMGGESRLVTLD